MWFFKKKTFDEKMVAKITLDYRTEEFELGITYVNVTFDDGRECSTPIYGTFSQHYAHGHKSLRDRCWIEAYACPPCVTTSYNAAVEFIKQMDISGPVKFFNDPRNVKSVIVGTVTDATIGHTESYKETHSVVYALEPTK